MLRGFLTKDKLQRFVSVISALLLFFTAATAVLVVLNRVNANTKMELTLTMSRVNLFWFILLAIVFMLASPAVTPAAPAGGPAPAPIRPTKQDLINGAVLASLGAALAFSGIYLYDHIVLVGSTLKWVSAGSLGLLALANMGILDSMEV